MPWLNAVLRPFFDLLQYPLRGLSPFAGVLVWSVPTAVFALWIFKKTSNQDRIAAVKAQIHACLFEIRLFNDNPREIVRSQWEILGHVVRYQALALKPMLWILPPLVLVMVHLHAYYGFQGLEPGDSALLKVELGEIAAPSAAGGSGASLRPDATIELPEGLHLETPGVWIPSLNEIDWRIGADAWGEYSVTVRIDNEEHTKSVRVGRDVSRLSPLRPDRSFLEQLEWPSEAPLPATAAVRSISVSYEDGAISVLGWSFEWRYAWMVVFFVLTMVIALLIKGPMGVTL